MTPEPAHPLRRGPGGLRPWLEPSDLLVAIVPLALTVLLLISGFTPILKALSDPNISWTSFAYQALVNKISAYTLAAQTPGTPTVTLRRLQDETLSSLQAEGEFVDLPQVEAYGVARLARVRALFAAGVQARTTVLRQHQLILAIQESAALNEQAHERIHDIQLQHAQQLERLRLVLLLAAALSGLFSMVLILRSLRLWRRERRVLDSQRELLSLASHELRRPLQSLLLATDLLRLAETPEDRLRYLSVVENNAAQVATRANLEQLESMYQQVTLDWHLLDLGLLLQDFQGPRSRVEVPEMPIIVLGDPARLRQIVENLHENALRYSSEPVLLTLSLNAGRPEIQVRDRGQGIDPDDVERLFQPRERGHQTGVRGSGLGLTIARRLARAHGAELDLRAAEDGGTVAVLRLGTFGPPVNPAPAPPPL